MPTDNRFSTAFDLRAGQITPVLLQMHDELLDLRLPDVRRGVTWDDLRLPVRAYHRVASRVGSPEELSTLTVRDLAAIDGFGKKSLWDLLQALRPFVRASDVVNEATRSTSSDGQASPQGRSSNDPSDPSVCTIDRDSVPSSLRGLPRSIAELHLPSVPEGVEWRDLRLSVRASTRVRKIADQPQDLKDLKIRDLTHTAGFGKKSLFELLDAIEAVSIQQRQGPGASEEPTGGAERVEAAHNAAREILDSSYAELIRSDDLRLGFALRSILPKARSAGDVARALLGGQAAERSDQLDNIVRLAQSLTSAVSLPLDREFIDLLSPWTGRRREIVLRYLGWDGGGASTLQDVGRAFGLTRERVRQICDRVLKSFGGIRPFAPALDRALAYIETLMPAPVDEVERRLFEGGYVTTPFKISGIVKAAEILHRKLSFKLARAGDVWFVLTNTRQDTIQQVLRIARRAIRHWGASTVADVLADSVAGGIVTDEQAVQRILQTQPDFEWLDEGSGWFWFDPGSFDNALTGRLRKALAVSGRVGVSEVRAAISKDPRLRGFAPPRRVILAACRRMRGVAVEGNATIVATNGIAEKEILSFGERIAVDVLTRNGGVMNGIELESKCLEAGMSKPNFWKVASGSPIILRYGPGVYGLTGLDIQPGTIEGLIRRRRKRSVTMDFGWLANRKFWISYRLSEGMLRNGIFGIPAAAQSFLAGEFALFSAEGVRTGKLVIQGGTGWGLGPYYTRRGGDPGDVILIQFDFELRNATACIGTEDLLDEYRSSDGELEFEGENEPLLS